MKIRSGGQGAASYIQIEDVGREKLEHVNKIFRNFPTDAIKAAHWAIKRSAEAAKTQAGRFAAEEYALKKSSFMSRTRSKTHVYGNRGGAVGVNLSYSGSVIPLLEFNTRYSRGGTLQTKVKRAGTSEILEHAFAERVYGPMAVFEHINQTKGPLEQKYGPSTAHMMANENVVEKMSRTVAETFDRRIDHEISRIIHGWGGKK